MAPSLTVMSAAKLFAFMNARILASSSIEKCFGLYIARGPRQSYSANTLRFDFEGAIEFGGANLPCDYRCQLDDFLFVKTPLDADEQLFRYGRIQRNCFRITQRRALSF